MLDEDAGIAYVTTHRENTIDRVVMVADGNRAGFAVAAGNPFTEVLVGPSSGAWQRGPGIEGLATTVVLRISLLVAAQRSRPDGVPRTAKVLRVTFPSLMK